MCDKLKSALPEIDSSLLCVTDPEEYDNLLFSYNQAFKAIMSWKANQLRSIQPDNARLFLLENLDESSVLVTEDWEMKFLPRRYRESQTDLFAKRGLSWHISVVMRKAGGGVQQQGFVHIVQNCNQDSNAAVGVLNHTVRSLKKEHPEITMKDFLRQDHANCYHNVEMLTSCHLMKESTEIKVYRVDFGIPQGGNGPCDRKAATVKAHVLRYVNEGNNVITATELKEAITSHHGVRGVRVAVLPNIEQKVTKTGQEKLDRISTYNNFSYSDEALEFGKYMTWVDERNFLGPQCKVLKILGRIAFLSKCNFIFIHFPFFS